VIKVDDEEDLGLAERAGQRAAAGHHRLPASGEESQGVCGP